MCYITMPLTSLQSLIVTFYGNTHLLFETSQRTEVGIQCTVLNVLKERTVSSYVVVMRGYRKFCQRGSNSDNVFLS